MEIKMRRLFFSLIDICTRIFLTQKSYNLDTILFY